LTYSLPAQLIEVCIDNLKAKPIVLRLNGWLQSTDRHALREIGFQLLQQTGLSMLEDSENIPSNSHDEKATEDDDNPFLDSSNAQPPGSPISLPPSSHLHTLIPILSTLDRPVIVVLDAFDLFALHPRQSLLYCLLDTVQNCPASSGNRGIAVIGITNRVDTIQLLEKRVKSRFSGRTIRTAPPNTLASWSELARDILHTPALDYKDDFEEDWKERWTASVDKLLDDKAFSNVLNETFSITRDVRTLVRILV
jgi:origin recognition complex subunit 4